MPLVPEGAGIVALERLGDEGLFELSDLIGIEKRSAVARHGPPSALLSAGVHSSKAAGPRSLNSCSSSHTA